jgi:iron complex outermembrane recepter protein
MRDGARALVLIGAAVGAAWSTASRADPAPAAAAAAPAQAGTSVTEIVVTAQKREQSINTVGMTITAASGATLAARGITDPSGLEKLVPGFTFTKSQLATSVYTLRGIGLYDADLASSPSVAVYEDEVPLPYPTMTNATGLDVQRVEVLKGPQGTLFGQSATGGAINFVPNQPTGSFAAGLDVGIDSYEKTDVHGFISGPINPTLDGRFAFSAVEGGAWQHDTVDTSLMNGAERKLTGRVILNWHPDDRLTVKFTGTANQDRSDSQAAQFTENQLNIYGSPAQAAAAHEAPMSQDPYAVVNPAAFAALTTPGNPAYDQSFLTRQATVFGRAASGDAGSLAYLGGVNPGNDASKATWTPGFPEENDDTLYQAALRTDYSIGGGLKLTSITSFIRKNMDEYFDNSGTIAEALNDHYYGNQTFVSEEARIAYDTSKFHGIIGASYDHTHVDEFVGFSLYDLSLNEPLPGLRWSNTLSHMTQNVDEGGVFANAEYALTDALKLTGGVRYNVSDRSAGLCNTDPTSDASQAFAKTFGNSQIVPGFGYYDLQSAFGRPQSGNVVVGPNQCAQLNDSVAPTNPGYFRPTLTPTREKLDETNLPWHLGASYQVPQGPLFYATISRGYKAGIISNVAAGETSQFAPAKQEELLAYEVGLKAPAFDHAVQFNASAFYYDYTDKQVRGRVLDPIFGLLEIVANVPHSYIYGFEGEVVARPLTGLSLSLSGTYLNSDVTSSFSNVGARAFYNQQGYTGDFKGSELPYTPHYSAVANVDYTHSLTQTLDVFGGATITYRGETNTTFANDVLLANQYVLPAYTILEMRLGLQPNNGPWKVTLFCSNCTNTYYVQTKFAGTDVLYRYASHPVTVGVNLSYRWN